MDPIERLMSEHRIIEKLLGALSGYCDALDGGAEAKREDLASFVRCIREFADAYHHGKEEDILFRTLVERGMPVEGGPIAVMLSEHDEGRGYVAAMAAALEGGGPFSADERRQVAAAARAYVGLLGNHIQKEDNILYPMARDFLDAGAWTELSTAVDEFEAGDAGEAKAAVLRRTVEELVAAFGQAA